jgi:hypothetical protein
MTGRDMRSRIDLITPTKNPSNNQNSAMSDQYNRHHGALQREFQVGEEVYVQIGVNKTWTAARVLERKGSVDYTVELNNGRGVHSHANQMKRRYTNVDLQATDLLSEFDIELPLNIEPEVVPIANPEPEVVAAEDENSDEEEFEDAEDDDGEAEEPQPRRSTRANAGIPGRYLYDNYEL